MLHRLRKQLNSNVEQLNLYDIMQLQSCKRFKFLKNEIYPSIRPPISRCSLAKTAKWKAQAMADSGCDSGRLFDMGKDDIVEVWKSSPDKDTLGYYGIGAAILKPEAVIFNQVLSKCLQEVSPHKHVKEKQKPDSPEGQKHTKKRSGSLILNRQMLKEKVDKMPIVQDVLHPSKAHTFLHCPRPVKVEQPFVKSELSGRPPGESEVERRSLKPKHSASRKSTYCEWQTDVPSNQCTDYELQKYKQDSKVYELAFRKEMDKLQKETVEEPTNYDELYSELVSCFEKGTTADRLAGAYKCCIKFLEDGGAGGGGDGDAGGERGGGRGKGRINKFGGGDGDGDGVGDGDGAGGGAGAGDGGGKHGIGSGDDRKHKKPKKKPPKTTGGKKKAIGLPPPDTGIHTPIRPTDGTHSQDDAQPRPTTHPQRPQFESSSSDLDQRVRPKKDKKKKRRPKKPATAGITDHNLRKPIKDCPCEVCDVLNRIVREPDSPLIVQMKRERKRRELRDYYQRMCHRQYLNWRNPQYLVPGHKCEPVVCDNAFCVSPQFTQHCDCLAAMNKLQQVLRDELSILDNQILFDLNLLKNRVCQRITDYL